MLFRSADAAEVLTKQEQWNDLSASQKTTITSFFKVTAAEMTSCATDGLDIIDSAIVLLSADKVGLSVADILDLVAKYNNATTFDNEISALASIIERITLTASEKTSIVTLMKAGNKAVDIAETLIMSRVINLPIATLISVSPVVVADITFTGAEKDSFISLVNLYNLNATYMTGYLNTNNKLPSQLMDEAYTWQEQNNFYIVGNEVSALSNL